jgi:cytidylate kinase
MAVITISRQFGSGGQEIAAGVCKLLGYRYLDKLLMTQVAAEVGLSGKEMAEFSEEHSQVRGFLERLVLPGPPNLVRVAVRAPEQTGPAALAVKHLDQAHCASLVQSAIHSAYRRGNVVIVGRGGQAVLQKMPGVLHVRVEAPIGDRILRVRGREDLSAEEARQCIIERDRASSGYLRQLFGVRWDDSALYHLVINTGKWELETAAQIIVQAVGQLSDGCND